MNNQVKKQEEDKKVKIMLCSLPVSKPVIQKKPIQEKTKTLPIKKQINKLEPSIKKEVKILPKVQPKPAPKPKPIPLEKKTKAPIKKVDYKPKSELNTPPKLKDIPKEPIDVIDTTTPEETKELKEDEVKLMESIQEKESRLAQEYMNENIKKISKLLSENLYYPRSARKRNIQGKVMVKFKLSRSAKAYDIEVTSSQSEILSRAAIRTIENLSEKFPSPQEELLLHVPISYRLNR